MFEEQPKSAGVPGNLPTEPEDIFSDVDKTATITVPRGSAEALPASSSVSALEAGRLKSKTDAMPPASATGGEGGAAPVYSVKEPIVGKILLAAVLVAAAGAIGWGGFWLYGRLFGGEGGYQQSMQFDAAQPATSNEAEVMAEDANGADDIETGSSVPVVSDIADITTDTVSDDILFGADLDSDRDGLSDAREEELGTDINNSDTDGDGLSDPDEVLKWKTDPLMEDTDGDGYADGVEIRNGYNPSGPGRLTLPAAVSTTP